MHKRPIKKCSQRILCSFDNQFDKVGRKCTPWDGAEGDKKGEKGMGVSEFRMRTEFSLVISTTFQDLF